MAFLARLESNGEITIEELDEDIRYEEPEPFDLDRHTYQNGFNFTVAKFLKTGGIPTAWRELATEYKDIPFHAGVLAAIKLMEHEDEQS